MEERLIYQLDEHNNIWTTEKGLFYSRHSVTETHPLLNFKIEVVTLEEFSPDVEEILSNSSDFSQQQQTQILCDSKRTSDEYIETKARKQKTKDFVCSTCGSAFVRKLHLRHHEKQHGTENNNRTKHFTCTICNHNFTRLEKLEKHRGVHQIEETIDSLYTASDSSYKNNSTPLTETSIIGKDFVSCKICSAIFRSNYFLKKHMLCHKDQTSNSNVQFSPKGDKGIASKNYHPQKSRYVTCNSSQERGELFDGTKSFQCDVCGKSFKSRYFLNIHSKTHSQQHSQSHTTEQHLQSHHDDTSQLPRKDCDSTSRKPSIPENVTCNSSQERGELFDGTKSFQCDVCGKSFKSRYFLNLHSQTHSQQHLQSHHDNTSQLPRKDCDSASRKPSIPEKKTVKCEICTSAFRSDYLLQQHMQHTHKESNARKSESTYGDSSMSKSDEKVSVCNLCTQAFTSDQLIQHQRVCSIKLLYVRSIFSNRHIGSNHARLHFIKKHTSKKKRKRNGCNFCFKRPADDIYPKTVKRSFRHADDILPKTVKRSFKSKDIVKKNTSKQVVIPNTANMVHHEQTVPIFCKDETITTTRFCDEQSTQIVCKEEDISNATTRFCDEQTFPITCEDEKTKRNILEEHPNCFINLVDIFGDKLIEQCFGEIEGSEDNSMLSSVTNGKIERIDYSFQNRIKVENELVVDKKCVDKKLHQCNICQKRFILCKNKKRHMRTIHKEKYNIFKCGQCEWAFSDNWKLNRHKLSHSRK